MSDPEPGRTATALAEVTRGLAGLHTRYYGKGPTRARSYLLNDTVVCFLEGGFTTVERTLIDDGRADAVHDMRRSFQSAMEAGFTRIVEEAMGHKVVAYMSQIHTSPDLAVELFVLGTSQDGTYAQHEETMS
jgi:uncharacterized protein YbcI